MVRNCNDGRFLIQFIDHGKTEIVKLENLKQLDEIHRSQFAFAVKAYFAAGRSCEAHEQTLEHEIVKMTSGEVLLQTNIIEKSSGAWIIDVFIEKEGNRESLCVNLISNKIAIDIPLDDLEERIEADM